MPNFNDNFKENHYINHSIEQNDHKLIDLIVDNKDICLATTTTNRSDPNDNKRSSIDKSKVN